MVIYGAFNDRGVDVTTGKTTDRFGFPGGSFRVTHKNTIATSTSTPRPARARSARAAPTRSATATASTPESAATASFAIRVLIVTRHTANGIAPAVRSRSRPSSRHTAR